MDLVSASIICFPDHDLEMKEVIREVRTCASHCDTLHYLYQLQVVRHLHIIHKHKTKKKYTVDRVATGKTSFNRYLPHGSRTANRTDSPYQTINDLIGNTY